jgi:hypothetical protein
MPYRKPAREPDLAATPRAELRYLAIDRASRQSTGMMALQIFSVPPLVALFSNAVFPPLATAVLASISAGWSLHWWRKPPVEAFLLRIEGAELLVSSASKKSRVARISLVDLEAVALQTKTIQRIHEGGSAIAAMRIIDSKVGPDVDTCRIVLECDSGDVRLGEKYIAHMDATEWLGKIRVFLRKNGWVPANERESEA